MTPRISHDYHPNISIRIPRKSSKLFGGDFAAAMARVTSFNRWAIIEHDLSTSTEVLRPPDEMQRLEESYGVGRGPSFFKDHGENNAAKMMEHGWFLLEVRVLRCLAKWGCWVISTPGLIYGGCTGRWFLGGQCAKAKTRNQKPPRGLKCRIHQYQSVLWWCSECSSKNHLPTESRSQNLQGVGGAWSWGRLAWHFSEKTTCCDDFGMISVKWGKIASALSALGMWKYDSVMFGTTHQLPRICEARLMIRVG